MKLNRRKLFAVGAGAAAAGPSAVRQMTEAAATKAPSPYYGSKLADTPMEDKDWTARQIARAKRIAAGEFLPEDEGYPTEGAQCPYMALHSVSDSAKWFMRDRRDRQRQRHRMIESAKKALDELDKFGVIRSLF